MSSTHEVASNRMNVHIYSQDTPHWKSKEVPVLSQIVTVPVSVLQLVRCNYEKSKYSQSAHAEGTMWYVPNYVNVVETATHEHYTTNDWGRSRLLKR